jgi:hypothetical protein
LYFAEIEVVKRTNYDMDWKGILLACPKTVGLRAAALLPQKNA